MRSKILLVSLVIVSFAIVSCAKKNAEPATPAKAEAAEKTTEAKTEEKVAEATPVTKAGVTVAEAVVCKKVEERSPIEPASTFSADVGRVYLFSRVSLDEGTATSIKHIWKYNGEEMASVTLPVRGPSWRTYSSKNIQDFQKGTWAVDITTEEGDLIKAVTFNIQ